MLEGAQVCPLPVAITHDLPVKVGVECKQYVSFDQSPIDFSI